MLQVLNKTKIERLSPPKPALVVHRRSLTVTDGDGNDGHPRYLPVGKSVLGSRRKMQRITMATTGRQPTVEHTTSGLSAPFNRRDANSKEKWDND